MFVSCGEDAKYDVLHDQAFIAQTNTSGNASQKLTVGNDAVSTTVTVRLSDPTAEDCAFELVADASVLDRYNERNSESLAMLPEEGYELSSSLISVEAGSSNSQPVTLTVNPFTEELSNTGLKYAIPLRLKSKDGKKNVLSSGSELVIVLDKVPIQAVPVLDYQHRVTCKWANHPFSFNEWTCEFNINMATLGTSVGRYNNQAIFSISVNPGVEIYARFGDAPIRGDVFQVKTQGTQMNSNTQFAMNTWYHLAIVCTGSKFYYYVNGVLDNSMDLPNTGYTTASDTWGMCNGSMLVSKVRMAEFRFWTKARTQAEIANSMYSVDPTSEGLEAYFKMNEGSGKDFIDATGHGNTATALDNVPWESDTRIDGK